MVKFLPSVPATLIESITGKAHDVEGIHDRPRTGEFVVGGALQAGESIQASDRAQVRAITDSIGHVEVFQMDGVGTPIIERPRPLPGHDTPNPAHSTHTLNAKSPYTSGIDVL